MLTLTVSAAVTLWSVAPVFSAPKIKDESPAAGARTILSRIDHSSSEIEDAAFLVNNQAAHGQEPEGQLADLAVLKDDINKIGSELRTLEAERGSLSEWEAKALDEVTPLYLDAAAKVNDAILTYNQDRQGLFATAYLGDTEQVNKDAQKAATVLHDYLKLAQTRTRVSKIEEGLGESQ
jgi:vacuolar-type H+-ATPase subunit I/STV1